MSFEPSIVGILCHYCAYTASDNAARAKLPVPPNLRTLRVPCTGRVDPELVVHALSGGGDGVLVCGCHPGDCHFVNGNLRARERFSVLGRVLSALGVEPGRVRLEWVSAQESQRYVELATEMVEAVRALGPIRWPAVRPPLAGQWEVGHG